MLIYETVNVFGLARLDILGIHKSCSRTRQVELGEAEDFRGTCCRTSLQRTLNQCSTSVDQATLLAAESADASQRVSFRK